MADRAGPRAGEPMSCGDQRPGGSSVGWPLALLIGSATRVARFGHAVARRLGRGEARESDGGCAASLPSTALGSDPDDR